MQERHVGDGIERTKALKRYDDGHGHGHGQLEPTNEARRQDHRRGTGGCRAGG